MPLPESPREVYKHNPLVEVVCQLRYPTILMVSEVRPAQFQEAIRNTYPLYEERRGPGGTLPINVPKEVADLLMMQSLAHHFSSDSETREIALTQDFVAVSERQYCRWGNFRKEVELAERVLRTHYTPAFYNRVGLKYVDVLVRSKLGLGDTPWSALLNPSFIGVLGDRNLADDVQDLSVESLLGIPDVEQGQVNIKHGIAIHQQDDEEVYVIDADFYTTRRSTPEEVFDALDRFNRWAGNLFRWATTDKLRTALEPTRIEPNLPA